MTKKSEFLKLHCMGVQYDTCKNPKTCKYGSEHGCTHPLFPRQQPDAGAPIFERNGATYQIEGRPWWVSCAYYQGANKTGKITVARCDAICIDPPTKCSNVMLDLTDEELAPLLVGAWNESTDWPKPRVVDGQRPTTNRTDRPITLEQVERAYALLQCEGEEEPEFVDRTPYQKGDAGDPWYGGEGEI
jgi:hypothetical protein